MIQETSLLAKDSIEPHLGRLESQVLGWITLGTHEGGMTCDELEEASGLAHQTASARIRDLAKANKIVASGARRKTRSGRAANVWVPWRLV